MKHTLTILFALFFSWGSLAANPTDKTNKTKEESEKTRNSKSIEEDKDDDESFFQMEQKVGEVEVHKSSPKTKNDDPDSSYYSVNKFNYLFYYLYKVKYLGIEDDLDVGLEP